MRPAESFGGRSGRDGAPGGRRGRAVRCCRADWRGHSNRCDKDEKRARNSGHRCTRRGIASSPGGFRANRGRSDEADRQRQFVFAEGAADHDFGGGKWRVCGHERGGSRPGHRQLRAGNDLRQILSRERPAISRAGNGNGAANRQGDCVGARRHDWGDESAGAWLGVFVHASGGAERGAPVNAATILVVDDEPQIRRVLRATLSSRGYVIIDAKTGEEGIELVRKDKPDLILLDVNMPGMGGLEACREIRRGSNAPIIMLTVRNAERDKVAALDAGADDYVVKPFGIEELLARVRAALRRHGTGEALVPFETKDLTIDSESRTVMARGEDVHLTPKEFEVLKLLIANQGKPLTHRRLLQAAWGPDYGEETENLRVVINQLRKKIESDPTHPKYILTEPWVGYRFQTPRIPPTRVVARK